MKNGDYRYHVVASNNNWGKGDSIKSAMKACNLNSRSSEVQFNIYAIPLAMFDSDWSVDLMSGMPILDRNEWVNLSELFKDKQDREFVSTTYCYMNGGRITFFESSDDRSKKLKSRRK
jgi:hypothetical protein